MDRAAYQHMAENEKNHWWFLGRRKFIQAQLKRFQKTNLNILEVGCGTGGNIAMLRQYGDVTALEMDDFAIEVAQKRHVIEINKGNLPDNHPFAGEKFDLIVLFDVLEHIERDVRALQSLKGLLAPEGRILITVPSYQFLWSQHDVLHHHFRRYSRQLLKNVVQEAGLVTGSITNFNAFLLPIAVVGRLVTRFIKTNKSLGSEKPSPLVNSILKNIFFLETLSNSGAGWFMGLSLYAEIRAK